LIKEILNLIKLQIKLEDILILNLGCEIMTSLGLESLDLDFQESKVYIILIAFGPLSLGEIIKNAEFTSVDVVKSLDGLKSKGYIHEIPGIALRYRALLPFNDLKTSAEQTISQMEQLATQLDEHIAQKLGVILGQLREESQKISEGLESAKKALDQAEMKAEGEAEARVARYVLETEQGTDQTKSEINKTFETKLSEHQALVASLKDQYVQKTNEMSAKFQESNKQLLEKYQGSLDELQSEEGERNQTLTTQVGTVVTQTQDSLTEGIQNVRQSMDTTGQALLQSIDERNEKLSTHITNVNAEMANLVSKISDDNQQKVISTLETWNSKLHQQLDEGKQEAVGALTSTREEIKDRTVGSAQNLQQTINETLVTAQNQIGELLQNAQAILSEKVADARNQVETSIEGFSEVIKVQTDSDIQKIVINTETSISGLAQEAQTTFDTTREGITTVFNGLTTDSKVKTEDVKGAALLELSRVVNALKTEITSHLDQFKETFTPQEQYLKEQLSTFQTELTTSRTQTLETFTSMMGDFKSLVDTNYQEIEGFISGETNTLLESINQFIEELNGQIKGYDSSFSETLTESAVKGSQHLIAQTRELQEKIVAVVNEIHQTATNQLSETSDVITASIQAEINTLETELTDYTTKFKEVSQRNEDVFKNFLFSLTKISSLVTDTKHPEVQTAPIFSKEASISYIHSMFSRMKAGITLLIPKPEEIPVDLILQTKVSQKVNIVSVCSPDTHSELLKKLFSKPNVKVKAVDTTRFEGVDKYIAADRDGEEVLIGIVEDQGETVAIASETNAFITLMGKIVLGDYFLARSQEIKRSDVGM